MSRKFGLASAAALLLSTTLGAQTPPADPAARAAAAERSAITAASTAERAREMALVGVAALRPGVSARDPSAADFANFDEAKANPYPDLPALLTMANGTKVTRAAQWPARRAEIAELFSRELYGRVPANVPGVAWRVASTTPETIGGIAALTKHMVGHVDNAAYPSVTVDILMNVTTPAATRGRKVPAVMAFGAVNPRPFPPGFHMDEPAGPDWRAQLLTKGWGFVTLDTASVQADNGAGLNAGIIGLTAHGQPRKADDWGVLRAWGWGASRGLDALGRDGDVDERRVAIFGHSRNGKAALVTLAYDPRFATGYISSSGAGGANLWRRNYGEGIGNLAAVNEFHWFAPNFLKYAAVGRTADDLPVDSHELIALVAPRPVFIGGGALIMTPASAIPGDAWQDTHGMFLAAVAAGPAWKLLGRKGLESDTFPPALTYLGGGDIGFRQHEYGHTPAPNWPYFIRFASKYWK